MLGILHSPAVSGWPRRREKPLLATRQEAQVAGGQTDILVAKNSVMLRVRRARGEKTVAPLRHSEV